jgi:hypothetical protein
MLRGFISFSENQSHEEEKNKATEKQWRGKQREPE